MDKMKEEDPEGFIDKLNQLEKDRAEERMSLKHRGGSKFAKKQAIYAKYDDRVSVMAGFVDLLKVQVDVTLYSCVPKYILVGPFCFYLSLFTVKLKFLKKILIH